MRNVNTKTKLDITDEEEDPGQTFREIEDYNGFNNSSVVLDTHEPVGGTPRDGNGDTIVSNFNDNSAPPKQTLNLAEVGSNASPLKMIKFKSTHTNELRSKLTL